jgi:hypothetical protein
MKTSKTTLSKGSTMTFASLIVRIEARNTRCTNRSTVERFRAPKEGRVAAYG